MSFKLLLRSVVYASTILLFVACSNSTPSAPSVPSAMTSKNQDLKPWVFGDPSIGDESNDYLYFVGQSAVNVAARGTTPPRSAFESAKANARTEYVRYMENLISAKTNEAVRAAGDDIEGQQTLAALKSLSTQFAKRTVSGLATLDSEYQSSGNNSAGIPLWKVWIRMRIKKEIVRGKFGALSKNIQNSAMNGVPNSPPF